MGLCFDHGKLNTFSMAFPSCNVGTRPAGWIYNKINHLKKEILSDVFLTTKLLLQLCFKR